MNPNDWYITPEEYATADKNGISRDTLEHRIRYLGWNKNKAISEPLRKEKFKKFNEWFKIAKSNGIDKNKFWDRINRLNWSYEKAATTKCDQRKKYPEWVKCKLKENGIKYNTFIKRIRNGWDFERAYTEKTMSKEEAIKLGIKKQNELCIGPYKYMSNRYKLINAKKKD